MNPMKPYRSRRTAAAISAGALVLVITMTSCTSAPDPAPSPTAQVTTDSAPVITTQPESLTTATPVSDPTQPPGQAGTPKAGLVDPATVNTKEPSSVALAAVTTMQRWDTAIDLSTLDATRRAKQWLDPKLAAGMLDMPIRGDAEWLELEAHEAWTDVKVELANEYGQPADTDLTAYVQVSYTVTRTGRDGWTKVDQPGLDRIHLSRASTAEPWLITGFSA